MRAITRYCLRNNPVIAGVGHGGAARGGAGRAGGDGVGAVCVFVCVCVCVCVCTRARERVRACVGLASSPVLTVSTEGRGIFKPGGNAGRKCRAEMPVRNAALGEMPPL